MRTEKNTPPRDTLVTAVPQDLDCLAWQRYRTVIVFGQVSKAAWWPPSQDGQHPGVLVSPGVAEARQALKKIARVFRILKAECPA